MSRGQLGEIFIVGIVAVTLFMASVFGHYFLSQTIETLNNSNLNNTDEAVDLMVEGRSDFNEAFDSVPLVMATLLIIGAGILAFILPTHIIFIVLGIISLFFLVPASSIMKAVYFSFTNDSILNTTAVYYTNTNIVMTNFPTIMLIADVVFLITMFVKGALMR